MIAIGIILVCILIADVVALAILLCIAGLSRSAGLKPSRLKLHFHNGKLCATNLDALQPTAAKRYCRAGSCPPCVIRDPTLRAKVICTRSHP